MIKGFFHLFFNYLISMSKYLLIIGYAIPSNSSSKKNFCKMVVWDKKIFKGIFWKMFTNEDKIDDLWIQKNRNGCYNLKIWLRTEILKKRLFWIKACMNRFLKSKQANKSQEKYHWNIAKNQSTKKAKKKPVWMDFLYYMNKMPIKTNKN